MGRSRRVAKGAMAILAAAAMRMAAGDACAADKPPAWEKAPGIPVETDFLRDRLEQPQNHFLLNGDDGFVSGREFYQAVSGINPFLWPGQPFARYGTDRSWQNDTAAVHFGIQSSNEFSEEEAGLDASSPYAFGDVGFRVLEGLRFHGGLEQNGLYSQRTLPARRTQLLPGKEEDMAWFGSDLPIRSQANLGGAFERRGSILAAQVNRGGWWTTSPLSGTAYPWEGVNADLSYRTGEDFDLTLVEQVWDSPSPYRFYKAHWRRSEINMSFLGASEGAWLWRFDIGYQRRALTSEGAFQGFEKKGYPYRFSYRQNWSAPDSLPFRMLSQGNFGYRDDMFQAQHTSEFRETVGSHRPMQFVKAYYRHPFKSAVIPTEYLSTLDSQFTAEYHPGIHNRGLAAGAEYREVRKRFQVGLAGQYALEWELPVFDLGSLDTLDGFVRRQGSYRASDYLLQNAGGRIFASGGDSDKVQWRVQAGLREFWGEEAARMEFLPSPWWAGAGAGYTLFGKTRLNAQATWMGPKEVRGWGPVFKVPEHWESDFSLVQSLFSDRLKLSLSGLQAFGEDIREQPNGNPVRFRILAGIEGKIY